ncbi:hypothetical protein SFRURICE_008608 [Spodoptera frugiperda]|nr:hypothetical protein SFRURICE_008608 [Spodoptera frugiperda]
MTRPAPIIGIGKEQDPSASYMQAHTVGNYALACCKVLRDDEASFCKPHRPRCLLAPQGKLSPSGASVPAEYRRMPKHS